MKRKCCCENALSFELKKLQMFRGQAHDKLRVPGFRGETNRAAILIDDPLHNTEPDARAYANRLRCVDRIEDLRLALERNA
jgi:hypothetical protein